jgi:hypothetical protein
MSRFFFPRQRPYCSDKSTYLGSRGSSRGKGLQACTAPSVSVAFTNFIFHTLYEKCLLNQLKKIKDFNDYKGRDLSDVWYALELGRIDPPRLIGCFNRYLAEEEHSVSRAQFEANLADKRKQPDFRDDVGPLLSPGFSWDFETAMDAVLEKLVVLLLGDPWKGDDNG